jgi:hypothetical protein
VGGRAEGGEDWVRPILAALRIPPGRDLDFWRMFEFAFAGSTLAELFLVDFKRPFISEDRMESLWLDVQAPQARGETASIWDLLADWRRRDPSAAALVITALHEFTCVRVDRGTISPTDASYRLGSVTFDLDFFAAELLGVPEPWVFKLVAVIVLDPQVMGSRYFGYLLWRDGIWVTAGDAPLGRVHDPDVLECAPDVVGLVYCRMDCQSRWK